MDYIVRQNKGEYPKVSEAELIAMAESGLLSPDTQVRKALMPTWTTAKEVPVLVEFFKNGGKSNVTAASDDSDKPDEVTAYENSFIPTPAGFWLRLQAWGLDIFLLIVLFFIVAGCATGILSVIGANINEGAVRIGSDFMNVTVRTDRTANRRGALVRERLRARKLAEEKYQEKLSAVKAQLKKDRARYKAEIAKARKEKATRAEFDKIAPVIKVEYPKPPPVKEKVSKFTSNRMPTITDDAFEGCYAGTLWIDTKARRTYVCISGLKNNAVWLTLPMVNSAANTAVICYVLLGVLLLGGPLLFRAQTFGMWYFGIFLSDAKDFKKEVLELRAFFYLLISVLTFYLNPLFLLIRKPVLAELITGTRVISIVSEKR